MKYAAIIFDMDGTIIDTEHIWHQATADLILSRGILLTKSQKEHLEHLLHGVVLPTACALIKEHAGIQDPLEILIEEKRQRANALYTEHVRFIQGFTDFHQKARAHNLAMAVATNADDRTMRITDTKLNLTTFFGTHLYNISHVAQGKPHPAIYLHAAAQLGVDPARCIAIEDSATGLEAALGAGMFCIGINTAKKRAQLHRAHTIVEGYHEIDLPQLLG